MRNLSEIIVLIRGGGEIGSAVAQRLYNCHFRICITELNNPLTISRGISFSEAIYDGKKVIEGLTAERSQASLEQIYKVWRNENIPVIADPEMTVKPLLKPDVLVNAMMLKRKTNTNTKDAKLVIGIGPGFEAGEDVHCVIESAHSCNLGRVIIAGSAEEENERQPGTETAGEARIIRSQDSGVFDTERNIGDSVGIDDTIGSLDGIPVKAPVAGTLRGIIRSDSRVLPNTRLAEIDPGIDRAGCFAPGDKARSIAGGVLEAVLMFFNVESGNQG